MYLPAPLPTPPPPIAGRPPEPDPPAAAVEETAPAPPQEAPAPLPVFGREGLVSAEEAETDAAPASAEGRGAWSLLLPLLGVAVASLLLHGLVLLFASATLPGDGGTRVLLTLQWLVGSLLVLPIGLTAHRIAGRLTPGVIAAAVVALHPGVLSATLDPGGAFWALAAAAAALFVLLCTRTPAVPGPSRPVPGVATCAAAGLTLGAGGVVMLPVAALAAPLALWRVLHGFGCPGPGRGPRDVVAGLVLLAAAAVPVAGFNLIDGDSVVVSRLGGSHAQPIPRLIEHRWPTLLGQVGLAPGVDVAGEITAAFEGPPADGVAAPPPRRGALPGPGTLDRAVMHAWTGLNAALLVGSLAAGGLALYRHRRALGLLMLTAVPAALLLAGPGGEGLRLALLPLQLAVLAVFWLPARRIGRASAVFMKPVGDAGFTIKQNTARVI